MIRDIASPADSNLRAAEAPLVVRAATPADAEAIMRMRSELILTEPLDEAWTAASSVGLARRLEPGGDARAVIVVSPDGRPASCALGFVHRLLPAPAYPKGLAGRVHLVATLPAFRRRGHARRAVSALLDQLASEGVTLFELNAGEEASPLYEQLGFAPASSMMRMNRLIAREDQAPGPTPAPHYAETVPKFTGYACVLLTDQGGRPVQLHATYSPSHPWQFPGGTMDHGEQPLQTAQRECYEETGLVAKGPLRLLASVFTPPGGPWPYATAGWIFDGGCLTPEEIRSITLDAEEHDDVRVLAVEDWKGLMPAQDFARLEAVMAARAAGIAQQITWGWGDA
ncbi:GNAT family N-acetyltransferase [Streptomyces sp. MBT55]|uniref:GNAT family N-acetyltransferase n=1 Tax=Streptomyces sp. MBT55 TaxID=1488386 RepID=UPI001F229519|nr:GNAT family N-acetyltransferase [Streptomyces sp. MBT55]